MADGNEGGIGTEGNVPGKLYSPNVVVTTQVEKDKATPLNHHPSLLT